MLAKQNEIIAIANITNGFISNHLPFIHYLLRGNSGVGGKEVRGSPYILVIGVILRARIVWSVRAFVIIVVCSWPLANASGSDPAARTHWRVMSHNYKTCMRCELVEWL